MDLVSPKPFWPEEDGPLGSYPMLEADVSCEVVVLGAGISGALLAERLAREGLDVLVLDKREAGQGSTSASTALVQYELDVSLTDLARRYGNAAAYCAYRLCYDSIDALERLAAGLPPEVFQRKPSVYLAVTPEDIPAFRKEAAARRDAGLAVEYLDEDGVAERFSFRRPAALLSRQAAQMNPYRLTHVLLDRSMRQGARVFDRTPVIKCAPERDGVRLATAGGLAVRARQVVFATGYESQEYLPEKIVSLKSTYAMASEPMDSFSGWWEQCLIWEAARPYLYLRTAGEGRALIGGEDDDFRDPERRDRAVRAKTDRLWRRFAELFPGMEFRPAARWAGTFGETKDGLAYIGAIRQMPHCHFALGFGGNGIAFSAIAADLISGAILGRPHSSASIFSFDR